ncbi:MAG TPA: hypothetical protein VFV75_10455 [Candidatus Polarisedimenticolaceae bacterium]|nr:hypothetical protein [Candidatus Polarisedimenticolaceae bacterium]
MNRIRGGVLAFACGLAWSAAVPARAEVGIVTSGEVRVPYVLAQITDDSDPWGGAWKRLTYEFNRTVLNPEGFLNGDGTPSIEVLPDGRVLAAWARNSPQGFDVVMSVHDPAGWSPVQVISGSAESELDPSLAVEANGTVHVVYTVLDPQAQESRVAHRQAPPNLAAWSAELPVSAPGELARRPSAAWDGQSLRVGYEIDPFGLGQTPRWIAAARLDAGAFEGEIVAVSSFAGDLGPRIHCTAARVWLDWTDAEHEVAWTRLDAQGGWESLRYAAYETLPHQEFQVRPGLRQAATAP